MYDYVEHSFISSTSGPKLYYMETKLSVKTFTCACTIVLLCTRWMWYCSFSTRWQRFDRLLVRLPMGITTYRYRRDHLNNNNVSNNCTELPNEYTTSSNTTRQHSCDATSRNLSESWLFGTFNDISTTRECCWSIRRGKRRSHLSQP